jgi:hypothetical protein
MIFLKIIFRLLENSSAVLSNNSKSKRHLVKVSLKPGTAYPVEMLTPVVLR